MIKRIKVKNFKSIENQNVRFSNLNIFAGANGAGKSTIIQTLLLIKQLSSKAGEISAHLNGQFIQLGDTRSVLHKWAKTEETLINFILNGSDLHYAWEASDLDVIPLSSDPSELANKIRYLGANRISPADIFHYSTDKNDKRDLGSSGEYSTAFLAKNGLEHIFIGALRHSDDEKHGVAGTYEANANAWLQEISPGIKVKAEKLLGLNASRLQYGYFGEGVLSGLSPFNVGFGITYVLPVVMLVLSAKPGDILVIENPEAHVHPRGQIALGRFLARAAHSGIQLIVETHSDHLFNGIRLYVKESKPKFKKFTFHYAARFENENHGFKTVFTEVKLTTEGRIKSAPVGFFDDWESAIFELI